MSSDLNPNAPEFHLPPTSVAIPQFFPPPPPTLFSPFNYFTAENYAAAAAHPQMCYYIAYSAAPPLPPVEVDFPISNGETTRTFLEDYYGQQGMGNSSGCLMHNGRRDIWYDNGEGSGRHENGSPGNMLQLARNRHTVMPIQRHQEQTTVMIKNVPYDFLREELISFLDEFCLGENTKAENEGSSENPGECVTSAYDFLYLPIDFRTKKGRGFAFVNFTNASTVWKLFESFHDKDWNRINWNKKIKIVCARVQGKDALVEHFSRSHFECHTNEFLPVRFEPARDGSKQAGEMVVVGSRRVAASAEYRKAA